MKRVEVAVGVLMAPGDKTLLGQRPIGKPYEGWWEFPGGKVELGEGVKAALARELHEELGIVIEEPEVSVSSWFTVEHDYPHAKVALRFCRVWAWHGVPEGREGQQFQWVSYLIPDERSVWPTPVLPATLPVLHRLRLPMVLRHSSWPSCIEICSGALHSVSKTRNQDPLRWVGMKVAASNLLADVNQAANLGADFCVTHWTQFEDVPLDDLMATSLPVYCEFEGEPGDTQVRKLLHLGFHGVICP